MARNNKKWVKKFSQKWEKWPEQIFKEDGEIQEINVQKNGEE